MLTDDLTSLEAVAVVRRMMSRLHPDSEGEFVVTLLDALVARVETAEREREKAQRVLHVRQCSGCGHGLVPEYYCVDCGRHERGRSPG